MHNTLHTNTLAYKRLIDINKHIMSVCDNIGRDFNKVNITAVSKNFSKNEILPLLKNGHTIFGENKVQEAIVKWSDLKPYWPNAELRMIGRLQSNKVTQAISIFDAIESVDRESLAISIKKAIKKLSSEKKIPKFLMQINVGEEPQKGGVSPSDADSFLEKCRNEYHIDIQGVMGISPKFKDPEPYFGLLANFASKYNLREISMGMSQDYEAAIEIGATHVRIGTAIFGER